MTGRTNYDQSSQIRLSYNIHKDKDLQTSNLKLKEDNTKLLSECIRLRKKCANYEQ